MATFNNNVSTTGTREQLCQSYGFGFEIHNALHIIGIGSIWNSWGDSLANILFVFDNNARHLAAFPYCFIITNGPEWI